MISREFKSEIGIRFKLLVTMLFNRSLVKDTRQLAQILDTSVQSISDMQLGKRLPTLEHIDTLAEELNVNPSWIIRGVEPIFIEKVELEEDIIVMLTKAISMGLIDPHKGEKTIEHIRSLQIDISNRDEEILKLNNEIIELMRLGFTKGIKKL